MVALDWPVTMIDPKISSTAFNNLTYFYPSDLSKHLNTFVHLKCNFIISIFTSIIVGINFQSQHILLHQYSIKTYLY
jgi:hypothetical protein